MGGHRPAHGRLSRHRGPPRPTTTPNCSRPSSPSRRSAGLSWTTILRKREGYRAAFEQFDPATVARFTERDIERLLGDASIVRHRGKIESTISNARAVLEVQREFGSLDAYVWAFVDGVPIVSEHTTLARARAGTPR